MLHDFGLSSVTPLQVASVITMMVCSPQSSLSVTSDIHLQQLGVAGWGQTSLEQGLDTSKVTSAVWNPAVFVSAVREVVPSINWLEVIQRFDNPYFYITDSTSLKSLMSSISAMKIQREFPIDFLLGKWKNNPGQVEFAELFQQPCC